MVRIAQPAASVVTDRRREPRIACGGAVPVAPCAGPGAGTFFRVPVVDCAPHGIGLLTAWPIRPGERFVTKLTAARITHVIYTVCRCRETSPGRYLLGAELSSYRSTVRHTVPLHILQSLLASGAE